MQISQREWNYLYGLANPVPIDNENPNSYRWQLPFGVLSDHITKEKTAFYLTVTNEAEYAMALLARGDR